VSPQERGKRIAIVFLSETGQQLAIAGAFKTLR
jgi:hypothetical protein